MPAVTTYHCAVVAVQVPKNERGNVECPPLALALPGGTVHLQMPGLVPVCRALAIDFAPGLVGFEVQGGRMVPKIDGVVVCKVGPG
jgi:xeroderma pigmentosum group C-complementing protein